jgi:PAS domain S-box-containing protein/diguanylate cyclase (GGDEF)-like protein
LIVRNFVPFHQVASALADEECGTPHMTDRLDLLEAALDSLAEGVALADQDGRICFWNRAAEAISGYESPKMTGKNVREVIDVLVVGGAQHWIRETNSEATSQHGSLVHLSHKDGRDVALVARILVLRDGLGARIGSGVAFHSAESNGALPHGDIAENSSLLESQAEIEDRLATMHEDFLRAKVPLCVLWVTVDQAARLRRTHGSRAVEAMMEKIERALSAALKPGEEIGRWGDDEFLVLSHERTPALLSAHAQTLAGMARTAVFCWWGDRVSLTVSIGAAQAQPGEELKQLLERAEAAMLESVRAGGNHATATQRRNPCSPS